MSQCWNCGGERSPAQAICPSCEKVQPPAGADAPDKFALLGLEPAFEISAAQLDESFRALSRKLHPDRFARASPRERRYSLEQTTLLNDAYRTLQDPVRRAEHLLALRGVRGDPKMSPAFLEETMEDRERLLEAKADGGPAAVEQLAAEVREKQQRTLAEVKALLEDGGDPGKASELLARMRYYARYLDEASGRAPEL